MKSLIVPFNILCGIRGYRLPSMFSNGSKMLEAKT